MNDRNFALSELDRVSGYIPRAEGKVTTLFPVAIAMLGVIAVKIPVNDPCSWRVVNAILAAACLAMCLWRVYETLFPRTTAPRVSLIFFGEIAKKSEAQYVADLSAADDALLIADAASQIWRNSEIVTAKYGTAKAAFRWLVTALPFWLIFLALVTLKDGKIPLPLGA